MNVFILEDNQERINKFHNKYPYANIVEDVDTAKEILKNFKYDIAFLDHDLEGKIYVDSNEYNTGMTLVKWIIENKIKIDTIVVHSCNVCAGDEMVFKLKDAGYNVQRIPFTKLVL